MTEPVYIDPPPFLRLEIHSTVPLKQAAAEGACHHEKVDFGKPERRGPVTTVSVVCLGEGCGHRWDMVKVHEPPAAKLSEVVSGHV